MGGRGRGPVPGGIPEVPPGASLDHQYLRSVSTVQFWRDQLVLQLLRLCRFSFQTTEGFPVPAAGAVMPSHDATVPSFLPSQPLWELNTAGAHCNKHPPYHMCSCSLPMPAPFSCHCLQQLQYDSSCGNHASRARLLRLRKEGKPESNRGRQKGRNPYSTYQPQG
jgi:hypothetical protein